MRSFTVVHFTSSIQYLARLWITTPQANNKLSSEDGLSTGIVQI